MNKDNFTDLIESQPQNSQPGQDNDSNSSNTGTWSQNTDQQVVGNEGEIITLQQK